MFVLLIGGALMGLMLGSFLATWKLVSELDRRRHLQYEKRVGLR